MKSLHAALAWWVGDDELKSDDPDHNSSPARETKTSSTCSTVTVTAAKRKVEMPPGMRFIPTPGNNLESAIYAIAIGYTADPQITRPLNWSAFDMENMTYHAFNSLFNTQKNKFIGKKNISFDPQRPLERFFLCWLITVWNSRSDNRINLFVVEASGSTDTLVCCEGGKTPRSIFIRLKGDRWEGCGYCQNPIPTVRNPKRLTTLPAISSIDIEPVPSTEALDDTSTPKPASSKVTPVNPSTESIIKSLRESSKGYNTIIDMLWCWTEVLGVSRSELLRPKVERFLEEYMELMDLSRGIMADIDKNITEVDEEAFLAKWQQYVEQESEEDVEPERNGVKREEKEDAKQAENKIAEYKEKEDVKERSSKDCKLEEHKEVKQTVPNTARGIDTLRPKSAASTIAVDNGSIEATMESLIDSFGELDASIQGLSRWSNIINITRNKAPRSLLARLISQLVEPKDTALELLTMVRENRILEEPREVSTGLQEVTVKQGQNEDVKRQDDRASPQTEHEEAKQREREEVKQNEHQEVRQRGCEETRQKEREDARQKEREQAKEWEREEIKQKEREKAQALATQYAAQDRYDSCSDSD